MSTWLRRTSSLLALVVPLAMLQLVFASGPASAAELCSLDPTGLDCGPTYAAPGLLSPAALAAATPAQATSLRNLEHEAVDNALSNHDLPASDREAMLTRGRYSAEMELYSLIADAAATAAAERTTDQQNALDWMTALLRDQMLDDMAHVGAEYVTFVGLDMQTYTSLLENNASKEELTAFFSSKQPTNYNNVDKTKATGGYCVYRAPAPYEEDYKGYNSIDCSEPCPYQVGCQVPTPKYDEWVDWGVARAAAARRTTDEKTLLLGMMGAEAATTAAQVSFDPDAWYGLSDAATQTIKRGIGGAVGTALHDVIAAKEASITRALLAVVKARVAAQTAEAAQEAVKVSEALLDTADTFFVDALEHLQDVKSTNPANSDIVVKAEAAVEEAMTTADEAAKTLKADKAAAKAAAEAADKAASAASNAGAGVIDNVLTAVGELLGVVAGTLLAALDLVLTLIDAIVTIVLASIELADAQALPEKLAELVVTNRTSIIDASTYFTSQPDVMLALFVRATGPLPRDGVCDNSLIPLSAYDDGFAQNVFLPVGDTGAQQEVTIQGHPCLNAPDVPPARDTDPQFQVTSPDGRQRITPTITTLMGESAENALPLQTRLSGNWFVTGVDGVPDLTWQNLQLYYLNSAGEATVATLRYDANAGWRFFGSANFDKTTQVNADTCKADLTCWASESIDYLAPDGTVRTARVVAGKPPSGLPMVDPAATPPVEGSPVRFTSNGFAPPASEGHDLFFEWKFQKDDCGIPCTTTLTSGGTDGGAATGPAYGDGADDYGQDDSWVAHTWQASGTYSVKLLVIDTVTKQHVEHEFTVDVADVAPHLDLHYSPGPYTPGQAVGVGGVITHAGTNDTERVAIYWGDGTSSVDIDGPAQILVVGSPITFSTMSDGRIHFASGHSYAEPGTYQALATVIDNGGGSDAYPFTITVAAPTG